jgi:hypothetical protein
MNYENARHLEGELIRYKNEKGDWTVGKVVKVNKNGLEIAELGSSNGDGYGFGFFRPFPFFRPPVIVPFVGFSFFPFFF